MYCPSCGSEERQLSQFCRACGVIVNGLLFTVPRKSLPGDAYDALSQKVLDSNANVNRLSYEAPAAATLPVGANLTNELAASRSQSSITEHTTHHLNTGKR